MNKAKHTFRHKLQITAAGATLLLAGCRVGPKYHVPPATAQAPPATYKESTTNFPPADGWKVAQPQDAMLRGKWWEIYNDPELNTLEDQLNINNQTIKQYFYNLMEARTLIAQARSQLFPTLTTTPFVDAVQVIRESFQYQRDGECHHHRNREVPARGVRERQYG